MSTTIEDCRIFQGGLYDDNYILDVLLSNSIDPWLVSDTCDVFPTTKVNMELEENEDLLGNSDSIDTCSYHPCSEIVDSLFPSLLEISPEIDDQYNTAIRLDQHVKSTQDSDYVCILTNIYVDIIIMYYSILCICKYNFIITNYLIKIILYCLINVYIQRYMFNNIY